MATTTLLFIHGVNTRHEEVAVIQRQIETGLSKIPGEGWSIETLSWADLATPQKFQAHSFEQSFEEQTSSVFSYGANIALDAELIANAVAVAAPPNSGQFRRHVLSFLVNIKSESHWSLLRSVAPSLSADHLEKCFYYIVNEAYIPDASFQKYVSWRKYIADLLTVIIDDFHNKKGLEPIENADLEKIRSVLYASLVSLEDYERTHYFPTEHRSISLKGVQECLGGMQKDCFKKS